MDCAEIRELISAWLDGEASPEEVRRVEEHLGACAKCRAVAGRMRALGTAVPGMEMPVPPGFRETVFARLEKEEFLPKRRSLFAFSVRWAAVPLAAVAAIALFYLNPPEAPRDSLSPAVRNSGPVVAGRSAEAPRLATESPPGALSSSSPPAVSSTVPEKGTSEVAGGVGAGLTPEDREIVANLEILEDPELFDEDRFDEIEIFLPASRQQG
ncbi:MAG TPA: anti-sigma factor [Candidatus Aquicultoraceae bacterium]|nr:anti-sigma factor [Candidatus Aquicultoraceae bacterium]